MAKTMPKAATKAAPLLCTPPLHPSSAPLLSTLLLRDLYYK